MMKGRMQSSRGSFPFGRANKSGVPLPVPGLGFFACVNSLSFSHWHRDLDEVCAAHINMFKLLE